MAQGALLNTLDISAYFLPYLLFFARTVALFLISPGFGEHYIPPRFRLMVAFALSFALGHIIPLPETAPFSQPLSFLWIITQEVLIGFMIGLVGRMILGLLDIAGTIIAMQVGLGNAMMFNPSFSTQMPFTASFLLLCATLLFFTLNLHHLVIHALVQSYQSFPVGSGLYGHKIMVDTTEYLLKLMGKCIVLGVQFSLPFLILGTVFQFFLGLLNRLVPNLQVFFVMLPAQLLFGLFLIMISFGFILTLAMNMFQKMFSSFPGLS